MLQENVLIREKPVAVMWTLPDREGKVNKAAILAVLERAAQDNQFIAQLTHQGDKALEGYGLDWQEKAALLSGDIRWIETHVGKLNARQRTWLECRLEQEIW
ncbi:MAG: hypothetical protein JXA89_09995 [Anaerolineae bacterium]|nr:hypothetical protein [Anaerolineae bacterium]